MPAFFSERGRADAKQSLAVELTSVRKWESDCTAHYVVRSSRDYAVARFRRLIVLTDGQNMYDSSCFVENETSGGRAAADCMISRHCMNTHSACAKDSETSSSTAAIRKPKKAESVVFLVGLLPPRCPTIGTRAIF